MYTSLFPAEHSQFNQTIYLKTSTITQYPVHTYNSIMEINYSDVGNCHLQLKHIHITFSVSHITCEHMIYVES